MKAIAPLEDAGPETPWQPSAEREQATQAKLEALQSRSATRPQIAGGIGMLRVMVVGDTGIGKSELLETLATAPEVTAAGGKSVVETASGFVKLAQLRVSTILEDALHVGEDRYNLTLLDAPGYSTYMDASHTMQPILAYHVAQFEATDSVFVKNMPVAQITRFLNAGTGAHTHTDVCLYGILHRVTPIDIEFLRRLAPHVNVVPVIVKSDSLRPDEVFALKLQILHVLRRYRIPIFGFGFTVDELLDLAHARATGVPPFAVMSSSVVPDADAARAINEFGALKDGIFYHHIDEIRASSAEKFVVWRQSRNASQQQ